MRFRTPSLRNLEFTFPYGHNGMFRTLRAVVGFYESTIAGESRNPNVPYEELDPRFARCRTWTKRHGSESSF